MCATELRLLGEILTKIRDGWAPSGPFEVPNKASENDIEAESPGAESTSILTSDGGNGSEVDISDLYDIRDKDGSSGFV